MPSTTIRFSSPMPEHIKSIEQNLVDVLDKHYYVNSQRFQEISTQNMLKHEICHLTKALFKIERAIVDTSKENIDYVKNEVMSDMLIYAIECSIGCNVKWWLYFDSVHQKNLNTIKTYTKQIFNNELDLLVCIRSKLIKAIAKLGDFCDKNDHKQKSQTIIEYDVVLPFFESSFYLSNYYSLDLDTFFHKRLIDVENKYVGQPNFKDRK